MKPQDKTYCIYRHTSPSGKVYIGQTCRRATVRWAGGNGYKQSKYFMNAIRKYGWKNFKHEILLEGISKSEADYAERYLIRWYKIHNMSYNISDGGDGSCGVTAWNKGKAWSKEVRDKVSKTKKGHKYGPQSALHSLHKAEAHKIPIVMVEIGDPNLRKYYKSAKDAEKDGFNRKAINRCLRNLSVQSGGYFWFYPNEFTLEKYMEKYRAWEKAKIHYVHETPPDWINLTGINVITCLRPKRIEEYYQVKK